MKSFFTARLFAAVLALGILALDPMPAQASQNNFCECLVTGSSPCTCTKNWKISPLATHSYIGRCDADGDGDTELRSDGYSISFEVKGRDKNTTCGVARAETVKEYEYAGCPILCPPVTGVRRQCTNWSLTKKDSTSTVVTCKKE